MWSGCGVGTESCFSVTGLDQESLKTPHPCGLHQDSRGSLPGVYQDSMAVLNGCHLERGPDGLQMDSR